MQFSVSGSEIRCLAGAVVASSSLTQEVTGSNNLFKIKYFFVAEFSENI